MSENKQALQVAALRDGTVIDHIPSEKLFTVVQLLGVEQIEDVNRLTDINGIRLQHSDIFIGERPTLLAFGIKRPNNFAMMNQRDGNGTFRIRHAGQIKRVLA